MAASSASSETLFSMTAFNHMMHMKLSSSNYLVWREQMLLVLDFHTLSAHVAADATPPPALITVAGKSSPNPDAAAWFDKDQKAVLLIKSSLTEEAAAEVLGLKGARDIWTALEQAYSNASVERIHSLRDSLRLIKKGRGSSRGRGRGQQQRRPPHCQLCRTNGHYASACPELHSFASKAPSDESLVKAFHAQCHVTDDSPDWRADSGATDYMVPPTDSVHNSTPYKGNNCVVFGNGSSQHIDLSSLVVTSFLDEPSFVSTVEHHRSPSTTSMPSSDTNMLPPFNFFEAESNAPAQQHVSETTSPVHEPTMSTDPTPVSGPENSSPNTATSSGPASASVLDQSTSAHPMQTRSKADVIGTYSLEVRKLSLRMLELICEGLGLERGYFEGDLTMGQLLSINHYLPCPDPGLGLGLPKHADPNIITVLFQENIYGLQVFKDQQWLGVEPLPHTFAVNIGHQLYVINHGVSQDLMDNTMKVAKDFFNMPNEENVKLYSNDPTKSCRLSTASYHYDKEHFWRDNLTNVFKDGQWLGVEPLPHAFVVNIGYQLEIISNGKLRSVAHRAVTNSKEDRTSIVTSIDPCQDTIIEPAKSMIDTGIPLYRPFRNRDFRKFFTEKKGDTEALMAAYKFKP
ncbi:hypothetical protein CTI12_AA080840 [Artemisia annua]|uniref:Fe2OG dioxygenase domain-containing protein n=1 Tax=Artemisia annua TaxID=35608 RepID=A0A2U1Q060_ARTAN|nr:hypothetical protein CTI12_AA080840 [Artemisia annua]